MSRNSRAFPRILWGGCSQAISPALIAAAMLTGLAGRVSAQAISGTGEIPWAQGSGVQIAPPRPINELASLN
jgi:hypothetical protein